MYCIAKKIIYTTEKYTINERECEVCKHSGGKNGKCLGGGKWWMNVFLLLEETRYLHSIWIVFSPLISILKLQCVWGCSCSSRPGLPLGPALGSVCRMGEGARQLEECHSCTRSSPQSSHAALQHALRKVRYIDLLTIVIEKKHCCCCCMGHLA